MNDSAFVCFVVLLLCCSIGLFECIWTLETNTVARETAKTEDTKDESEDAGKDDSKEKTPLVEPDEVSI